MERLIATYFEYFNRHSVNELSGLLDENVRLEDWNIEVEGLANVLDANNQIFADHPEIVVEVVRVSIVEQIAFAEIKIDIGDGKKLDVLDVIETDPNHAKIRAISAFRKF